MNDAVANDEPEALGPASTDRDNHVSAATWMTVFGGVLGAFIAVLNIHITNASLKDIQEPSRRPWRKVRLSPPPI